MPVPPPAQWRPWPGGGPVPPADLAPRCGPTLARALAGLALRHQLWTRLAPLPAPAACAARGLPLPAELVGIGATSLPDRARLRRWLDSPAGQEAERAARAALLQAAAQESETNDQRGILAGVRAGHAHLDGVQRFGSLLAATVPAPPDAFAEDAAAGAAWLLRPGRIALVAEHQRWPPGGGAPLTEHRWLAAHLRLLLHLGGLDQTAPLAALFGALPAAPLRWYEGWAGIPPDSDSLGLWLRVAGALGQGADPRVAAWCAPLAALPAGALPGTWLGGAEAPAWGGDRCGGVQSALALGLLAARPAGWRAWVPRLVAAAAPAWHYQIGRAHV